MTDRNHNGTEINWHPIITGPHSITITLINTHVKLVMWHDLVQKKNLVRLHDDKYIINLDLAPEHLHSPASVTSMKCDTSALRGVNKKMKNYWGSMGRTRPVKHAVCILVACGYLGKVCPYEGRFMVASPVSVMNELEYVLREVTAREISPFDKGLLLSYIREHMLDYAEQNFESTDLERVRERISNVFLNAYLPPSSSVTDNYLKVT